MKKHTIADKCFIHTGETDGGRAVLSSIGCSDQVVFGFFIMGGGYYSDLFMRWYPEKEGLSPQLEVPNKSWAALTMMRDVIAELGDLNGQPISPKDFVTLLKEHGFTDKTMRVSR